MTIDFSGVQLNPGAMYANELFGLNDVTISGPAVPGGLTQETFSFAFANQKLFSEGEGFTATASFTSSAVIPEPAIMVYMTIAIPMMIRRRMRRGYREQVCQ